MSEKDLVEPVSEAGAPPMVGFITEVEFARRIKRVQKTAWLWRKTGRGPKPTFIGRDVLYAEVDVAAWLAAGGTRGGGGKALPRRKVRGTTDEPKRRGPGRPKKAAL